MGKTISEGLVFSLAEKEKAALFFVYFEKGIEGTAFLVFITK